MTFASKGHAYDTKEFSPTRPTTLENRDEPGRRPPSTAHLPHLTVPEPGGPRTAQRLTNTRTDSPEPG